VNAGKDLALASGGNINVTAVKDRVLDDLGSNGRASYLRNKSDAETVIGSNLTADKNIKVEAVEKIGTNKVVAPMDHGNIIMEGSTISSKNGSVTVTADQDITVTGTTERQESLTESRIVSEGFLSKKVTEKRDQEILNAIKSSTVSGETVEMKAGKDLTIQASNVVGTNDVKLSAGDNINLASQDETGKADHYSYTKKSGLFSGGGLGFTIGSKSEKTTNNEQTLGAVGSTIGSEKGNIFITAGEKVNSAGTTFISGNDLNITGKDVTIDNTINTYDSQTKYEFKQSGLSVSVGGGAVATATKAVGNLERAGQVQDDRLKALYDYKAFEDLKDLNKELGNGINKESLGVSVNVSIGSSKMTSEQTVHTETVNTSNINAGGNVVIKATEEDVTLKGTKINAKDITIDAAKDITIESAENKQQIDSKTSSSSVSVGTSFGTSVSYFGNSSKGSGKEHENATTNTGSTLDASGTLTLKSGEDTTINGSQAKGEKVVADIGGDLNIASQQDTDDYTAKNKNSGIGFSTGAKGGRTGSIGKGKTDSTYASVTEQAGIYAGKDGFDIHVGKNTDLKGAVIASDATPDKNKISTGTLTYSDIQNKAEYSASSVGVNLDTRKGAEKKDAGLTPNIGVKVSGDSDSTTKSAIAPGTITITGNQTQDLSNLSRDTNNSLNTLGKIFDKKTVQEKQELAKVFGEEAYKFVGELSAKKQVQGVIAKELADNYDKKADEARKKDDLENATLNENLAQKYRGIEHDLASWNEGGANKIALHGLVGGIMSQMGGSNFTSGAVGAGVNEAIQKELSKIKDPGLHQIASGVVGATASKMVGGNAQSGASTAISGTKNNILGEEYVNAVKNYLIDKCKPGIKDNINSLISVGLLSRPDEMEHDYRIFMAGASLPIRFVAGASGYILDKKGNVYALIEVDGGFGVSTPVQITDGFGNFKAPEKENANDYKSAIEGWSLGGGGASGVQVSASVSTSGLVSTEVTGTTAIGTTLFAGRYVQYLFNLNED
jgi:filamentous hemagglutinin